MATQADTRCPAHTASEDTQRAAATLAFRLMRLSAAQAGNSKDPKSNSQSTTILAPQRYRIMRDGTGMEFDPTDPLYGYVTSQMKAEIAFAQADSSVARFLSDGLKRAYEDDDGQVFPHVIALPALGAYSFRGPVTRHIDDRSSADNSHFATVDSKPWCGATAVTISETVGKSHDFSPITFIGTWALRDPVPASFKGKTHGEVAIPFNGGLKTNPYLIISVNGKAQQFNTPRVNCWENDDSKCTSTIEIDPVPYAEPGDYYSNAGIVGTQGNPYILSNTVLYADPSHAGQWATRTVNATQEWGTFRIPVTFFGTTKYMYAKAM